MTAKDPSGAPAPSDQARTDHAPSPADAEDPIEQFQRACAQLKAARQAARQVVLGQDDVIDQTLIALLSGGHALLVGAPGLAKTLLVKTLATVMGLDTKRVQFTPDLMPGDILGSEVLEEAPDGARSFRFLPGPVFCQLLMADEINRASPRTQSALLQAMQERYVTVAGVRHETPRPFHVLATQNPLEQEGTYPLPEAQLDRFLLQIDVSYPALAAERDMLLSTTGESAPTPEPALTAEDLMAAQRLVRQMPAGDSVVDAILSLVRSARPGDEAASGVNERVAWGPGPRASQALMMAVRARALIEGRYAPSLDDVAVLAPPVLRHRIALNFSARADGGDVSALIEELTARALGRSAAAS
ncbi:MAG: MoxR family ATPase [Pseudomonadota bacterium]